MIMSYHPDTDFLTVFYRRARPLHVSNSDRTSYKKLRPEVLQLVRERDETVVDHTVSVESNVDLSVRTASRRPGRAVAV